jgi:hypothetical protein
MKPRLWLLWIGGALLFTGCITHEETVYRDTDRLPVEFENDTAARVFYERLSVASDKSSTDSKTQVHIPLVFRDERKTVSGPNRAFNRAVERCDTNKDGRITEQEARIFASRQ